MKRLAAGHFLSAEVERRTQERQCPYLGLLVRGLAIEDAKQFVRQHGAHAGSPLRSKRPRSLQEAPIEGEGDVLFHVPDFILHVKYVNRPETSGTRKSSAACWIVFRCRSRVSTLA